MYAGKLVFAQVMEHLPLHTFRRIGRPTEGEIVLLPGSIPGLAQLTYREKLRHRGLSAGPAVQALPPGPPIARNTLANANAVRDWRIYADFAQSLIAIARPLYVDEPFGVDLKDTVYALDTTTIDLCLAVFPWAPFRTTKAAVKLHTLLDLRGNILTFIYISDGKMHEVNILDQLLPEPGAFYVMDRGFLDFERLYRFHEAGSFFVTRGKSNLKAQRRFLHSVDRTTGLICDQTIALVGFYLRKGFDAPLRRIRFKDPETGKTLVFLTNNFALSALTITELYRCRWQVELFFKWIKQHLRIKAFFGTSENAVKAQIWIAVSVYILAAIVKKRLSLSASLYEILQILSLTMFERMPLDQLLAQTVTDRIDPHPGNQLILFGHVGELRRHGLLGKCADRSAPPASAGGMFPIGSRRRRAG